MKFDTITVKNFKCFDDKDGCSFDEFEAINIIIGRNNSGKSSFLDIIKFLCTGHEFFYHNKRKKNNPELLITHYFDAEKIEAGFSDETFINQTSVTHYQYAGQWTNSHFVYKLEQNYKKLLHETPEIMHKAMNNALIHYMHELKVPFTNYKFVHLAAERDILPDRANIKIDISNSGSGATNYIQEILNNQDQPSELIETTLLNELNTILQPDMYFNRILVQKNKDELWEIYFEEKNDGRIPLSKMGSGIKTILLVLLHLVINPEVNGKNYDRTVFALEELENNLHPSLQRRLYHYLYNFALTNKTTIFLTTHSNVVIDLFSSLPETKIFHIVKENGKTVFNTSLNQHHFKNILDDLDIRASDILQSNGIIWVEGPSDRHYLNKWISLIDHTLIEGNQYSIMFYGGRLLSNLSFSEEQVDNELIPLLKLNRNSYVIMDRDGSSLFSKPNQTKRRIEGELGNNSVWITKGREIENYLSKNTISEWLNEKYGIVDVADIDKDTKFGDKTYEIDNKSKIAYSSNKNKYALEIIDFIGVEDLKVLDLSTRITNLINEIRKWNKVS